MRRESRLARHGRRGRDKGRLLATTLALFLLISAVVPTAARASVWSLDNLIDWIEGQRPADPAELAGKLPAWPEWRGFCPGLDNYFVNVGREFRRLCGPQLEEKKAAVLACRDAMPPIGEWTPGSLLSQAGRCTAAGKGAVEVWGELAHCTLSSYITASDMTEQQRREWDTFLSGISDFQSLLELGDVFKEGKFAKLRNVKTPKTLDEALALAELGQELRAEPGKRLEKIHKAPEQISGVRAAIETLPFFEEWRYARLRDEAVELLESCRPDEAQSARTRAELAHFQRLQAARAAYVLAEEQFYCAAKENRFEIMTEREQQQVLSGYHPTQPSIYQMKRQDLKAAELDHRTALASYRDFLDDPDLAEDRFRHWEERSKRFVAETADLLEQARACIASCGSTAGGGCRFPLDTAETMLRAQAENVCAAALGAEAGLLSWAERVEGTRTARNNYDLSFDRHRPKIESLLAECQVNDAMVERVELEREIRDYERLGTRVESCWDDRLSELEQAIDRRRSQLVAQMEEAEGLLAAGRQATDACRWDEAETAATAAYDAGASTGCAPEIPELQKLYGRIDSLMQEIGSRRARDDAERGRVEQRIVELRTQAWADLELARGDGAERCQAVGRVRAAADELAGLGAGGLCPDAAGGGHTAEAEDLSRAAEEAASRNRDALTSLLTTAHQAEEACDVDDVAWAAGEIESLPPVCDADLGAIAADLRHRHRRLADGRRSAREHLRGERRRIDEAVARPGAGAAAEVDAVLAEVRSFAPEGVPRSCYGDLVDEILARGGATSGGGGDGTTGASDDSGAGDGWVIESGGDAGTVVDRPPATPTVPPPPAQSDPAAGLIRAAEGAFDGCDLVSAQTLAERIRQVAPDHPWLQANDARIAEYAERQRRTANQLSVARNLVQRGRLKDARDALVEAARDAPGCMSEPVDAVVEVVQSSIRERKEANRSAIASGLGGLLSAIGQVAAVVAASEGNGLPPAVGAAGGSGLGGGSAGGNGGSQPSCYYVPNRHHSDASFRDNEHPPVWVVQVAGSPGSRVYTVLPVDSRDTSRILAHLRSTTGADYLGPYGSKAAAESVARQRCPNTAPGL